MGRARATVGLAPVPPDYLPPIAQIILLWGAFETELGELIGKMSRYLDDGMPAPRKLKFHQKMEWFERQIASCFQDCPKTTEIIGGIVKDWEGAQDRRNAIVHGEIYFQHDFRSKKTVISARGERRGSTYSYDFDKNDLLDLQYIIADLLGRVRLFGSGIPIIIPKLAKEEADQVKLVLGLE